MTKHCITTITTTINILYLKNTKNLNIVASLEKGTGSY